MLRFTDLRVWQEAHRLVLDVYGTTKRFPADERFGLTSQMRRSVVSVPANIAEGARRKYPAEYARILNIGEGSLAETEYFIMLARDLRYLSEPDSYRQLDQVGSVGRMLDALRRRVEQR